MKTNKAPARRRGGARLLSLGLGFILLTPVLAQKTAPAGHVLTPAWLILGRDFTRRGEFARAIEVFEKAMRSDSIDARGRFECLANLGILRWDTDDIPSSLKALDGALALAIAPEDAGRAAYLRRIRDVETTHIRALELRAAGNLAASDRSFGQALAEAEALKSREHELKILRVGSVNFLSSKDGNQAAKYLEWNLRAAALAADLNDRAETSRAESNIGTYYYHLQGAPSRALAHFLRGLYAVQGSDSYSDIQMCLSNVATAYQSLGDLTKARDYVSEALELRDKKGAELLNASLVLGLGRIFEAQAQSSGDPDDTERAREYFTAYLRGPAPARDPNFDELARIGLARIDADAGRLDEAEAKLTVALANAKRLKEAAIIQDVHVELGGISLARGRIGEAEAHFREALAAAERSANYLPAIRAHTGLGRCREAMGDTATAVAEYEKAVEIVVASGARIEDDAQRAEFVNRSREPYQALMGLYDALARTNARKAFANEMYRVSESSRAAAFLDYEERREGPSSGRAARPDRAREASLDAERLGYLEQLSKGGLDAASAAGLESRIRHIDDMLDARILVEGTPAARSTILASTVSLAALRSSLLPEDAALVEYFLGDRRSYVICVTKKDLRAADLPAAADIQDSLTAYLSFLEDPRLAAAKSAAAAHRLYQDLLGPVEGLLAPGIRRLIIVPDGVLFRLPFETLMPVLTGSPARDYLVNRYEISYAPSASALASLRQKPKTAYRKDVLGFGVSTYPRPAERTKSPAARTPTQILDDLYRRSGFAMTPIPYAKKELENLAALAGPGRADIHVGPEASEGLLKSLDLAGYRIIHFACHAFSDENYPLSSSLVLSTERDPEEDGYLQVSEMSRMRIAADLVVLSACQTGRGRILRNAGLLGLPRVFFTMGARSVVSTLWRIDDKAAAEFMRVFYAAYFSGVGKAAALRQAKLKMIGSRGSHPYEWAAYTLTGEF